MWKKSHLHIEWRMFKQKIMPSNYEFGLKINTIYFIFQLPTDLKGKPVKKTLNTDLTTIIVSLSTQGCSTANYNPLEYFQTVGIGVAVYELECAKDKLDVVSLGGASYGVMGCGKKAIYVGPGESGFVRTSDIKIIK